MNAELLADRHCQGAALTGHLHGRALRLDGRVQSREVATKACLRCDPEAGQCLVHIGGELELLAVLELVDYRTVLDRHSVVHGDVVQEVDDALREFAPVVRLSDGTHMLGRHEHVSAGLLDWKAFSSASRPWHDPSSPRPEILLTDDPPRHTQVRKVIADALSPRALERIRDIFEARAVELLAALRERAGEPVDAVGEITQAYVFRVLPDILGLPEEGQAARAGQGEIHP